MPTQPKKKRFDGWSVGIVLSLALSFLITVFAPLELFIGSQADFWFDHKQLLSAAGGLFLWCGAILCALFLLLRLCGRIPYAVTLAVFFALFTAFYVHGTFLSGNLPALDGTTVDWSADLTQRLLSGGIVLLLLGLCLFLALWKRELFYKIVLWGAGGLTAVLLLSASTLFLTTDFADKDGYLEPTAVGDMTYSTDQNLIVLVTDAVDSDRMLAVLKNDVDFADTFSDFTCFTDALAGYPFTRNSLPLILSGQWYENKEDFDSYVGNAVAASPLIHKLTQDGYRIGIYNNGELHFAAAQFDGVFENQINLKPFFATKWDSYVLLLRMSSIRYAPWELKFFGYGVMDHAEKARTLPTNDYGSVKKNNVHFYNAVKKENALTLTEEKCARILHIEGGHVPYRYNKQLEVIENGTYEGNLAATLTLCKQFLATLKAEGVYDNSAIVIMSDHGYSPDEGSGLKGRTHPFLIIKGVGETGTQMVENDTPISYEQMADALVKLTDKAPAASLFPKDAYPDGRRYIGYWYLAEHSMEEYLVTGRADEVDKINLTGNYYRLKK